jgi:anti-sigma factor RsiW
MNCSTYQTLVTDHADDRLDAARRGEAESHLSDCPKCARLLDEQGQVRGLLRARRAREAVPPDVRERILAAVASEARRSPVFSRRRWLLVGAVAALALFALLPRWPGPSPDLVATLARDVEMANADRIGFALQTDDPEMLRVYYRDTGGLSFAPAVPDLRPMGLRQVGGRVDDLEGVPTALTIFDGPSGKVVCRRFLAGTIPLPEGGRVVGDATVHTHDGVTLRIVRDGEVICVLAAEMPEEDFIREYVAMG